MIRKMIYRWKNQGVVAVLFWQYDRERMVLLTLLEKRATELAQ